MTHLHEEIRIEAPVEHVWALFCDTSRWNEWMPWGECSDFSGPVDEVGTTYVHAVRIMGFERKWTMTVVEVEPQRLYHEHSDMGPTDLYGRFEPAGDSTHVAFDADYETPGKLPRFIKDLMVERWMEPKMRKMLADVKAVAEEKAPAHA